MIADSIMNLRDRNLILAPENDPHIASELKRQGAGLQEGVGSSRGEGEGSEDRQEEEPAIM